MKILGLDIGTHSLGVAVRNTNLSDNLKNQLEYFSVDSFNSGISSKEYSYAAERSSARRTRVLFERRRRRNWATLKLLIQHKMCPLSELDLEEWTTYDKNRGLFRRYPIDAIEFEQWIRLDFNGDGKPDYTSPYQLRRDLMSRQFDFSKETDRYKFGRAIYHISQRRGFKSSKGETLKDLENNASQDDIIDINIDGDSTISELKKSEESKSGLLVEYMKEHSLKTVGCAFAKLEDEGVRIRGSKYQAVRSNYKDEIIEIFKFQKGLANDSDLFRRLISEKKGEGTIFYKCPLKSQKGLIGKCILEPNKTRCPISHPKFEEFRAWSLINNIKYKDSAHNNWIRLSLDDKEQIYSEIFTSKVRSDFSFGEIRKWIEKKYDIICSEMNYNDSLNVPGCPITARLIKLLGSDWESYEQIGTKDRWSHSKHNPIKHTTSYNAFDIWHVCYSSDEDLEISEFAKNRLYWDESKSKQLERIWSEIREGYARLSLKAITNINYFLRKGLIYSDAVILAKVPEIIGREEWTSQENKLLPLILGLLQDIKQENSHQKTINNITNRLIANYKSLGEHTGVFAYKDYEYTLDASDKQDVLDAIVQYFGNITWNKKNKDEQFKIQQEVEECYQNFFHDKRRKFMHSETLLSQIIDALDETFDKKYNFNKLYHHSDLSDLSPYTTDKTKDERLSTLGNPNIGAIKNPVALRTMHIIRKRINALIENGIIDPDDTRVVIETTRNYNDSNKRWAIKRYQEVREAEHAKILEILKEFSSVKDISDRDIDKIRFFFEQQDDYGEIYAEKEDYFMNKKDSKSNYIKKLSKKYKLWKEQGCVCLYTGNIISIANLFSENTQIEHTIPRSISYDNSLSNLTVCDSYYNRAIKNNKFPTQLPNYEKDAEINGKKYTAIQPRLKNWEVLVEQLINKVASWKTRARKAVDKERKDFCIRQMHLMQMELDYWNAKLMHFKQTEIPQGFRNRQLVDTGLITRHTAIYLKSLFQNVDVQKGEVTAEFRKILGIQKVYEQKNRDLLSHHAIDALVLTLIPVPAKRERMLKLFYQKEESLESAKAELEKELKDCQIGNGVEKVVNFIESHLLVNHLSSDKTFVPAKKVVRKRGKVVLFKHKDGSIHSHISTGDSIRASLHKETFYGAIKYPDVDQNGIPIVESGRFVYNDTTPIIVKRIPISEISQSDLEKIIIDPFVKKSICTTVAKRMAEGLSYKEAISRDLWMLDKDGNEIKYSKTKRKLCPIRHVRCKVKASKAYLTFNGVTPVREHLYASNKLHKQKVYTQNDGNYLLLIFKSDTNGCIKTATRIVSFLEVAKLKQEKNIDGTSKFKCISDLIQDSRYNKFESKGIIYYLDAVIKKGTRLLKWETSPNELHQKNANLNKFLYITQAFNDRLHYKFHLNSKTIEKCRFNSMKFLIEGRDFEIDELGNVKLKK